MGISHAVIDAEAQNRILATLRCLVGGPRSLRFPPAELVKGLALLAGQVAAMTGRSVDETNSYFAREFHRAPIVELKPIDVVCEDPTPEEIALFLSIGLERDAPAPRPTRLVLGAVLCLLGQLARGQGASATEIGALIRQSHTAVPKTQIANFQRLAAQSLKN